MKAKTAMVESVLSTKSKDNESEWWGQLPNEWQLVKLKHIGQIHLSNVDKHTVEGQESVLLCNYVDVYKNERITSAIPFMRASATDEQIKRLSIQKSDVLLTKDSETPDDIGVPALVAEELTGVLCGYHLAIMRPDPNIVVSEFLLRAIQSKPVKNYFFCNAVGMTRYGLDKQALAETPVALPSLERQRAIAAYLDRETAKLNALIAAKERLLALLAEKRRALITHAVTRGLNPYAPMRDSGVGWLGEIPAHWKVARLKTICESLQTGPFGSQLHAEDYIDGGIPSINPAHLVNGRIIPDGRITVDEETAQQLAIHQLQAGDVVFARRGEIGRCAVVTQNEAGWLCGTGSLRARPDKTKLDSEYLVSVVTNTFAGQWLSIMSVGTTMDNLNTEIIGELVVPLPPLIEQRQIILSLVSMKTSLDSLIQVVTETIKLLYERRKALIEAAVSGKIQVTG